MFGHAQRFQGAGASATHQFYERRRQNIRNVWRSLLFMALGVVAFAGWSLFVGGVAGRFLALIAGIICGVLLVFWSIGGHVTTFFWWQGVEGERNTGREIEKLSTEWHCEHDLVHEHGNWDHVLVGPAGVFLLDSKSLYGIARAGDDALRAGRFGFPGVSFRGGAWQVKQLLEEKLGSRAPWVQAVAVIWGDFPQARHEEHGVVYLRGNELLPWLNEQPHKANGPQRAALVAALKEVRASLAAVD
jgi:hypothetical protein